MKYIIQSYFSDGSGTPEVRYFDLSEGKHTADAMLKYMRLQVSRMTEVNIYRVEKEGLVDIAASGGDLDHGG